MKSAEFDQILKCITDLLIAGNKVDAEGLYSNNSEFMSPGQIAETLGNIAFYSRDLQGAIDNYERAITLNPGRLIARYQYLAGVIEERSGNVDEALERYQSAIGADPGFVDAYVELGGLLSKNQRPEGAARCFRDALLITPDDPYILHNLKMMLSQLVKKDPGRYTAELQELECRFTTVLPKFDPLILQRHRW